MKRLHWILLLMILLIPTESISAKKKTEKSDREIWCDVMYRMAAPVLSNMSEGLLKQNMLVELSPTWDGRNQNVTYMECFGRLMDWHRGCHCPTMKLRKDSNANNCGNGH